MFVYIYFNVIGYFAHIICNRANYDLVGPVSHILFAYLPIIIDIGTRPRTPDSVKKALC